MALGRCDRVLYAIAASAILMAGLGVKQSRAAQAGGDAKQAITKAYSRMDADAARRDVDAELSYCTPSFLEVKPSGKKMTIDEVRYNAKMYFESADLVSTHTKIVSFAQHGSQIVVTTKQTERIDGMAGPKKVSIRSVETDRDTWTDMPTGWRMSGSVIVSEHVTVNGHAVAVE
jgi:hypothetical protein